MVVVELKFPRGEANGDGTGVTCFVQYKYVRRIQNYSCFGILKMNR